MSRVSRASWASWALVFMAIVPSAQAQRASETFSARDTVVAQSTWRPLRIAKWGVFLASSGAAVYGFLENREADREYEAIERVCDADPAACATQPDGETYVDAALEARYRAVLERDDRAQLALIAGQVGLAASVLLFILDLSEGATPDDIPYDPRPLRLGVRPDKVELVFRWPVR
jgi:hypothetical protein